MSDDEQEPGPGPEPEPLRRGPWTPEEDAVLKKYVEEHGERNWKDVSKNTSLNRCGKSCRLRWRNHLRSNLNKGPFSPAEEAYIFSEVKRIGTRWCEIVKQLPGRTDNDIKNFWHTRSKQKEKEEKTALLSMMQFPNSDTNWTGTDIMLPTNYPYPYPYPPKEEDGHNDFQVPTNQENANTRQLAPMNRADTDQEKVNMVQFPNSDTNWADPIRVPPFLLTGDTRRFPPLILGDGTRMYSLEREGGLVRDDPCIVPDQRGERKRKSEARMGSTNVDPSEQRKRSRKSVSA